MGSRICILAARLGLAYGRNSDDRSSDLAADFKRASRFQSLAHHSDDLVWLHRLVWVALPLPAGCMQRLHPNWMGQGFCGHQGFRSAKAPRATRPLLREVAER